MFLVNNYINQVNIISQFTNITLIISLIILVITVVNIFWKKSTNLIFLIIILLFFLSSVNLYYLWEFIKYYNICSTLVSKTNNSVIITTWYINLIGAVLIWLCFITGVVSIILLGDRFTIKNIKYIAYFMVFYINTIVMVSTNNILIMYLGFEFIFIPTIFYALKTGYLKRINMSIWSLVVWTLSGSFLVLLVILKIYAIHKTLNYQTLLSCYFSTTELQIISTLIFLGLGVKIPVFPLHYWLTKIHVEAPAGFSIFLSGFLVKAALFCLTTLLILFQNIYLTYFIVILSVIGAIDASLKMWLQTDFKKLIAYATIQEMNLLLLLSTMKLLPHNSTYIIFLLLHGVLSALMFFSVEVVQRRTSTRNISLISGIGLKVVKFQYYLWIILLVFLGFPFTIKFQIELYIVKYILNYFPLHESYFLPIIIIFLICGVGALSLVKFVLTVLYGNTNITILSSQITNSESLTYNFLLLHIFLLMFLYYLFYVKTKVLYSTKY